MIARGLGGAEAIRWPLARASALFGLKYGKALVESSRRPGSVPVYGTNGVTGSHDAALFKGPGVVLGRKGVGNLGVEWVEGDFWVIDTAYALTAVDSVDLKFAYYLIKHVGLNHLKHGTSNPSLTRDAFGAQFFPVPPLAEQRRIAGVLGALDDLIDANLQEADRLDDLCRAMGRQFVLAVADRPLARIDELATVGKGYSYRSSELKAGNGWLVNLKNVGRDGRYQPGGLKPLTGNHKPMHVVENGDICVAQTDLTQKREVIGRPVRVRRGSADGELVASLDLLVVRPGPTSTREYLYAVLDSETFRSHALGFCNGTTVLHMASAAVPSFEAPIPDHGDLHRFSASPRPADRGRRGPSLCQAA